MKRKTDDWLKNCEICSAGLCVTVDGYKKEKGVSERAACQQMAEESGGLYSGKQILDRYRYHTGKDRKVSEIPTNISEFTEDEILQAAKEIEARRKKERTEITYTATEAGDAMNYFCNNLTPDEITQGRKAMEAHKKKYENETWNPNKSINKIIAQTNKIVKTYKDCKAQCKS